MSAVEMAETAAPPPLDADLALRLDGMHGAMRDVLLRHVIAIQEQRDATKALSPVKRRRVETRELMAEKRAEESDRHHIHSVLALCGLPYREPGNGVREHLREYGKNSLAVQAGYLKDPGTGKMTPQGLPYGPKARLLLLHICTMAIRQKRAEIEIADSMTAFIRDLGFAVTGGQRGTVRQFKEQLNRLAAARMQIGLWHGDTATTINAQPIKAFDIWLPRDAEQRMLWSSTLRLDQDFFDSLRKHALPVDIRVLKAFSQSAKQIDMVMWLAYRLRRVERRYPISWNALAEQFGANIKDAWRFRHTFAEDLAANSDASRIKEVCIDMSGAFIKGVTENLTEAEITFDKFHVMKMLGEAVDKTRRAEAKARPELKGSRYVWLKNEANLSAEGRDTLATLSQLHLKTARAYQLRCAFQEVYAQPSRGWAELMLDTWDSWAIRSRIEPIKAVAKTIRRHRDGILAWFGSHIANGLIEGINSLVQAAKAKARGYRNRETLKVMTYLIAGKLDLRLPT